MTDFNTEIELRLPSSIREIWNKLVVRGIYISADNERNLYNDILRYEDNIREFFEIFDQTLVVHRRDFVYAEDRKVKRVIKNAEQLMVFLSVFFEKFRKLYPSPLVPWYEELSIKVVSLGAMNLYSTESFERRLLSVGLHDELDIFEKVLRPAATSFLLHIHSSDIYSVNSPEDAIAVEFKFNAPIYRFIDIFADIAGYDVKILPEADNKLFSAEDRFGDISFEEPDNDGGVDNER